MRNAVEETGCAPDAMAATLGAVLRDRELRHRLAAEGPGLAEHYSARRCGLRHLEMYESALAARVRRVKQRT